MAPSQSTLASATVDEEPESSRDIFYYASTGEVARVKALLDAGAEVNARGDDGGTVLHWACDRGHAALVEALLDRGAEIDAQDDDGMTPLAMAGCCEHDDIAMLLIKRGADPRHEIEGGERAEDFFSDGLKRAVAQRA